MDLVRESIVQIEERKASELLVYERNQMMERLQTILLVGEDREKELQCMRSKLHMMKTRFQSDEHLQAIDVIIKAM